jgi:hypothetical protein
MTEQVTAEDWAAIGRIHHRVRQRRLARKAAEERARLAAERAAEARDEPIPLPDKGIIRPSGNS